MARITIGDRQLTEPQSTALRWLTPGEQYTDPTRQISRALDSLVQYHPDLATMEWKETRGGRRYRSFALTELGATVREGIVSNAE